MADHRPAKISLAAASALIALSLGATPTIAPAQAAGDGNAAGAPARSAGDGDKKAAVEPRATSRCEARAAERKLEGEKRQNFLDRCTERVSKRIADRKAARKAARQTARQQQKGSGSGQTPASARQAQPSGGGGGGRAPEVSGTEAPDD